MINFILPHLTSPHLASCHAVLVLLGYRRSKDLRLLPHLSVLHEGAPA